MGDIFPLLALILELVGVLIAAYALWHQLRRGRREAECQREDSGG